MDIQKIKTISEFDDYLKSSDLLVVHFSAAWAAQCTQISELLADIARTNKNKNTKYAQIEAEDLPELSMKYAIKAVPTVLLIRNSAVVDRVDGVDTITLDEKIKKQQSQNSSNQISETDRLKALINQAPCMLFMKGDRETPRCGFSRTIVGILNDYQADYETFDILKDNTVREGLKKYSNWPTYPQLYVNGELLGGLDIVKEMSESGELKDLLPKKTQ